MLEERRPYRDHVAAGFDEHLPAQADAARAFWRDLLAGFTTPTASSRAPGAHADRGRQGHATGHVFGLVARNASALRSLCEAHGLNVPIVVEAAWALVLSALRGEDDVVFGSRARAVGRPFPGRRRSSASSSTRSPCGRASLRRRRVLELLRAIRAQQVAVRDFEHTPLVDVLAVADDAARRAPLRHDHRLQRPQQRRRGPEALGAAVGHARDFALHDQTNFPFNVMGYEAARSASSCRMTARRFDARDGRACRRPARRGPHRDGRATGRRRIGELPALPAQDAVALRALERHHARPSRPLCIHDAFEAQVDRTPDATAVVFRDAPLTYRELDERANAVAHDLARPRRRRRRDGGHLRRALARDGGRAARHPQGGRRLRADGSRPIRASASR